MDVIEAMTSRRSVRAFKPDPVPKAVIGQILEAAARAPSGTNIQPWKVTALAGAAKQALTDAILKAREQDPDGHVREYNYYPGRFPEPYLSRRRKVGWDMYGILGIKKGETARMRDQHSENFKFFGAPVHLICSIDREMEKGSWLDYGMFMENIMLAARGFGLSSCPQAAIGTYHKLVRQVTGIADEEIIVAGISIGYEDETAAINALRTEREALDGFVDFLGFE